MTVYKGLLAIVIGRDAYSSQNTNEGIEDEADGICTAEVSCIILLMFVGLKQRYHYCMDGEG